MILQQKFQDRTLIGASGFSQMTSKYGRHVGIIENIDLVSMKSV
jgi:hypothetical protein